MKSVAIFTLLAATAIAVSAELSFPRPNYYGRYQISARDADISQMWLPDEIKTVMTHNKSPAKDFHNNLYIPIRVATDAEKPKIRSHFFTMMFLPAVPITKNGYRLYRIGTCNFGGYKRYLYTDIQYNLYAKV